MKEIIVKYLVEFGMETTDSMVHKVEEILPSVIDENNNYALMPDKQINAGDIRKLIGLYDVRIKKNKDTLARQTAKLEHPYITENVFGIFKHTINITDSLKEDVSSYGSLVKEQTNSLKTLDDQLCNLIADNKMNQDVRNAVIRLHNCPAIMKL